MILATTTLDLKERVNWLNEAIHLPSTTTTSSHYLLCLYTAFILSFFYSSKHPPLLNDETRQCLTLFLDLLDYTEHNQKISLAQKLSIQACKARIYAFFNEIPMSISFATQIVKSFPTLSHFDLSSLFSVAFALEVN